MKTVRVEYTVNSGFVEQNKANIRAVMNALKESPIEGMYYSSYQLADGNSFMHLNIAKDETTIAKLNDLKEFKAFRAALKESKPLNPPKAEQLTPVDFGWEIK